MDVMVFFLLIMLQCSINLGDVFITFCPNSHFILHSFTFIVFTSVFLILRKITMYKKYSVFFHFLHKFSMGDIICMLEFVFKFYEHIFRKRLGLLL